MKSLKESVLSRGDSRQLALSDLEVGFPIFYSNKSPLGFIREIDSFTGRIGVYERVGYAKYFTTYEKLHAENKLPLYDMWIKTESGKEEKIKSVRKANIVSKLSDVQFMKSLKVAYPLGAIPEEDAVGYGDDETDDQLDFADSINRLQDMGWLKHDRRRGIILFTKLGLQNL